MAAFEGTFTALVTPFRDGRVDEKVLRDLVELQIGGGISGLVPCGTTGESPALSEEEHHQVIRVVVEQAKGRVPVIAGAGTASTDKTIALAKSAQTAKADGLLLVAPYYNRPTQAGLIAHFRTVLNAVPIPAILYNIPGRTGVDVALESLEALADVPSLVAIKEATGNVLRSQQIIQKFGSRFTVLSGDDALTVPVLAIGGRGVISVSSNLAPRLVSEVVRKWQAGQSQAACDLHLRLCALHEVMFVESNPGPIKAALFQKGLIAPELRLPLVWPTETSLAKIRNVLAEVGA